MDVEGVAKGSTVNKKSNLDIREKMLSNDMWNVVGKLKAGSGKEEALAR